MYLLFQGKNTGFSAYEWNVTTEMFEIYKEESQD
jgi:hypothetical protein